MTRANIPIGRSQLLEGAFPGSTLTDLNGDGLAELIVTADSTVGPNGIRRTTILWNRGGQFVDTDKTELPLPLIFTNNHIDHDVQRIDVNHDGAPDFYVQFAPGSQWLAQDQPLIWLNDGAGHFSTLTVGDSVAPGKEWLIGSDFLVATRVMARRCGHPIPEARDLGRP